MGRSIRKVSNRHGESLGDGAAALAGCNRGYDALTKIKRIRSGHPCWPPAPANILNQKLNPLGIQKSDSDWMNPALGAGPWAGDPARPSMLGGTAGPAFHA